MTATSVATPVRPLPRIPSVARRAVVHGLVVGGLAFLAYTFLVAAPRIGTVGFDAFAYWSVQLPDAYRIAVGELGAFTYTPPAALVSSLAGNLQWWVFLWVWLAALLATAIWLGGRKALLVLAFPPVAMELYHGNVNLLIAAAIVLAFEHPWTWTFVLLTKPTSGVGLLWFAARREWRQLTIALGVTAIFVALSLVVVPGMWRDWLGYLVDSSSASPRGAWLPVPLWIRLPAAAAIVVWGARTDRPWTIAVGATLALPVLWFSGLAILVAMIRSPQAARRALLRHPVPAA